ncbi:phospholipase D-like domain-containing protein [Motiliproteus sediminis]|uniref:phospholipase D-like domain-containing protein n=1 Tax=Motiliproteus sediminis TaxID=1468178 RepID=UPI001AEF69AF
MRLNRHQWSWHEGNCSELLVDGARYFPAMLGAIGSARRELLLEFYYVRSGALMDRLIEALVAASEREVRVCLLIDGFGGRELASADRQRLIRAGVQLAVYNPIRLRNVSLNLARDHRKLLLVDGEEVFTGGTGLTDEFYSGATHQPPWHELMLRLRGPVVGDWRTLFARQWWWVTGEQLAAAKMPPPCGHQRMKIATTAGPLHQGIKVSFRRQINRAEQRVWMVTAYFLPSWSVRRALRRAARRGVDVRLLLPGPYTDHPWLYHAARRYYHQLLLAGVRIFEYQPRFVHAKVSLCDDWVSLGSCNMDHWNLRWNLEANQEVQDADLAAKVVQTFVADQADSQEITLAGWQQRPRGHRIFSFVVGYVSALLLRLF